MEERKGKPIQAMQLLFVITIVAIPLAAVSLFVASWLNCIPALVVLIGAMMLYRSIGSKYLKVSAITGVIYVVLYIVSELIPVSNTETALGGQTVLTVVAIACGLVHQFTLLRGAADYMEGQGCPETAREGRTAAVLSVVGSIGSLVVAIVGVATLTTFSIILSLAAGFLALVLVVIGIIALFSRLSFFYRSMKRLKDGLQETPIQTQEKK